jgi:hypothetical protein
MIILSALLEEINKSILCGVPIYLEGDDPRRNTYCMRKKGHSGEHNIVNCDPSPVLAKQGEVVEVKPPEKTTADIILEQFGPKKHD